MILVDVFLFFYTSELEMGKTCLSHQFPDWFPGSSGLVDVIKISFTHQSDEFHYIPFRSCTGVINLRTLESVNQSARQSV